MGTGHNSSGRVVLVSRKHYANTQLHRHVQPRSHMLASEARPCAARIAGRLYKRKYHRDNMRLWRADKKAKKLAATT